MVEYQLDINILAVGLPNVMMRISMQQPKDQIQAARPTHQPSGNEPVMDR